MEQVEVIKLMRQYLDEVIKEGATEKDTRFSNEELLELYDQHKNINKAVSVGWTIKAGMIARELGSIDEYSTGNERYKNINLTTAINAALAMSKQYEALYKQEQEQGLSGFILKVSSPEVI